MKRELLALDRRRSCAMQCKEKSSTVSSAAVAVMEADTLRKKE
jgi:hypothetical protein